MLALLELATLALIPSFLLLDLLYGARRFARPRGWRLLATAVTIANVVWTTWFALTLGTLFAGLGLFDLSGLGAWGAIVGVLVYEFGHYWYHRAAHRFDGLWRAGHQMHHSAESLDAFGAFWLHPLDAAMFSAIQVLVFFPLLGLAPEAGAIAALFLTFNAMFQHADVRTPRWLGYLVQRPESHLVHHGRGVHAYNYSDLPLWDLVFGTLRNPAPEAVPASAGFYHGASRRLLAMLAFRDVGRPPPQAEAGDAPEPLPRAVS
jgi:sterol desaturase/sphingolipid hydroxylase (fatty acid hydroxylase superfamily)